MATLAQDLQNRGIQLVDPFKEHQQRVASDSEAEQSEATSHQEEEEEEEDDDEFYTMPSKTVRIADPLSPELGSRLKSLSIKGPIQTISGSLPYPMLSGRWEVWDHNLKILNGYCMMRMLLHSGTKETDYKLDWVDKKTLKIKLKWPIFMQNALFMTGLDVTETHENYPEGHQVYTDMGKNSRKLEDEDGFVYSEGFFRFSKPMDMNEDKYKAEVFECPVDADGNKGTILQVLFLEKSEERKVFTSPVATKKQSKIRFSKSQQQVQQEQLAQQLAQQQRLQEQLTQQQQEQRQLATRPRVDNQTSNSSNKRAKTNTSAAAATTNSSQPKVWLQAFDSGTASSTDLEETTSFHSSNSSIASSGIDPIKTFLEAKSYLDDLEKYLFELG